jgi:hypothetical protein
MRQQTEISNEKLLQLVPAAFTQHAAEHTSDVYGYVPTYQIIDEARKYGFVPVQASQGRSRKQNGNLYAAHMIKMRHASSLVPAQVDDIVPELCLYNSHNAGSSLQIIGGIHRYVCANGLMVSDNHLGSIKVIHKGNILEQVAEGFHRIIDAVPEIIRTVDNFKRIELTKDESEIYAQAARSLKWDATDQGQYPVNTSRLLSYRRFDDNSNDLWSVFNRVQENILKGGIKGFNMETGRRITTRAVNSVKENVRLNKSLWELTEKMAELKG